MPQKVVSPASAIGGEVLRSGLVGYRVRPKRSVNVSVIERLREQIRCIEGRTPALGLAPDLAPELAKPAAVHAPGRSAAPIDESSGDASHQGSMGAHGTALLWEPVVHDQTGFPAVRFADEDGGALPRTPPALPSSSSSASDLPRDTVRISQPARLSQPARPAQPIWTLGDARDVAERDAPYQDISQLPLDVAGVHEIKPAFHPGSLADQSGVSYDWAAAWSAARAFALVMSARRVTVGNSSWQSIVPRVQRPILWCMPRRAQGEHGALYGHGLRPFGLTPADVVVVETGNAQDTLWVLEEALKSEALALVAGMIDDVALTPARRLALAAQKHNTPCLLMTHPRSAPVVATATRWRVAASPGAKHPLSPSRAQGVPRRHFNGLGARRFAVALERYRAAPAGIAGSESIGRESIMEWSDEALCLHMVANVSDRSHAPRVPGLGAAGSAVRAG